MSDASTHTTLSTAAPSDGETPSSDTPPTDQASATPADDHGKDAPSDAAQPGVDDKDADTKNADTKDAPKDTAPDTYEFTPPEGMEVDPDALSSYQDLAREHGLSQEQFSAITQHGLGYFQQQLTALSDAQQARDTQWRNAALSDRDLSDGKTLKPEVMRHVSHVFDQFGGDELRQALIDTGAGNHPQVIQALNNIGKALGAAQTPDKGKPASELKGNGFDDIARRRYGASS